MENHVDLNCGLRSLDASGAAGKEDDERAVWELAMVAEDNDLQRLEGTESPVCEAEKTILRMENHGESVPYYAAHPGAKNVHCGHEPGDRCPAYVELILGDICIVFCVLAVVLSTVIIVAILTAYVRKLQPAAQPDEESDLEASVGGANDNPEADGTESETEESRLSLESGVWLMEAGENNIAMALLGGRRRWGSAPEMGTQGRRNGKYVGLRRLSDDEARRVQSRYLPLSGAMDG
ncbi:hypothetical protein S7711_11199 [Stachybotrys chartarum IBT 7711]|uniref:Uncharacterized protein n=1 Tax=Stachybotrys chartarum (strain CBS 109288 / IBT 7711) TaxID=1280523 RepID=A0A084AK11_STACB|nr:hypothetical protein S7711_11199 [Stachybotrys chartarum IBT 7711]